MSEITAIKTYNSNLFANSEKNIKYLRDTGVALKNTTNVFRGLLVAFYGGITPEIARENIKIIKKEKSLDMDLIYAINRFRPVRSNSDLAKYQIPQPVMRGKFESVVGHEASELAAEFLNSPIGEDYVWIDGLRAYEDLKSQIGDFDYDLKVMVRENILPIYNFPNIEASASISRIFGNGKKEDREFKVGVVKKIKELILNSDLGDDYSVLQQIILSAAGAKDMKEFSKTYVGKAAGRRGKIQNILLENSNKKLGANTIQSVLEKCDEIVCEKSSKLIWKNNQGLLKYIEIQSDLSYDPKAYSECFKAALAEIQPKNTVNYNFAVKRLQNKKDLESNVQAMQNSAMLNNYFDSHYFQGSNNFVICPYHLGGENLSQLFKIYKNIGDSTEAVKEYCSELRGSVKDPIPSLCEYVLTLRDLSCKQIIGAASYNQLIQRYKDHKVHPTKDGNNNYTFSTGSAMYGCLIPPNKAKKTDRPGSPDSRIWMILRVLNGKKWEDHHYYIHNVRFLEEVYAHNPEFKGDPVAIRGGRFGGIGKKICESSLQSLRENPQKYRKTKKRLLRLQESIKNNSLPNINWNEKIASIGVRFDHNNFKATINFKIKVNHKKFEGLKVGDKIMSYDQNQTQSHAYAVMNVCNSFDSGAIPFRGHYVQVNETGKIRSNIQVGQNNYDPLSYSGLSFEKYENWRNQRKNFVSKYRFIIGKNNENCDMLEELEKIESRKPSLYEYNYKYSAILRKIVRGTSGVKLDECRKEIISFLAKEQASIRNVSSLNHHSFSAFRSAKSLISAYFAASTGLNISTDEQKQDNDPEIFEIRKDLERSRKNKCREKINKISNTIVTIANMEGCNIICGEFGLSSTGSKNNTKKQNNKNMDWLARGVEKKIKEMCLLHNIHFKDAPPHYTSHQDPFVYNNTLLKVESVDHMKARFAYLSVDDVEEWHLKKLSSYLKNNKNGTAYYYNSATKQFLDHYGLVEHEEKITKNKLSLSKFKDILIKNFGNVNIVMPLRGGRYYLASKNVVTGAVPFSFGGSCYLSDADEVAAINVGLTIFPQQNS